VARLAVSQRATLSALGEGQKCESGSGDARGQDWWPLSSSCAVETVPIGRVLWSIFILKLSSAIQIIGRRANNLLLDAV
jgi:hypothetical protein